MEIAPVMGEYPFLSRLLKRRNDPVNLFSLSSLLHPPLFSHSLLYFSLPHMFVLQTRGLLGQRKPNRIISISVLSHSTDIFVTTAKLGYNPQIVWCFFFFFLHLIKVELLAFVQNEGERVFSFSLTVFVLECCTICICFLRQGRFQRAVLVCHHECWQTEF